MTLARPGRLPNAYEMKQYRPKKEYTTLQVRNVNEQVRDNFREYCEELKIKYSVGLEYLMRRVIKNNKRLPVATHYKGGQAIVHARQMLRSIMCLFRAYCAAHDYNQSQAIELLMLRAVQKRWPIEDTRFAGSLRDHVPK